MLREQFVLLTAVPFLCLPRMLSHNKSENCLHSKRGEKSCPGNNTQQKKQFLHTQAPPDPRFHFYIIMTQVISLDSNMVALNGRIHEISEHLRAPASDIFSLLSSHSELSGWAAWVQLVSVVTQNTTGLHPGVGIRGIGGVQKLRAVCAFFFRTRNQGPTSVS